MLMLLEIWLTVKAWKNGWRGWTLVLWGCHLLMALGIGLVAAAVDIETLYWIVLIACDMPLAITLGAMIKHPRLA